MKKETPPNKPITKAQKKAKAAVEKAVEDERKDVIFGGDEKK